MHLDPPSTALLQAIVEAPYQPHGWTRALEELVAHVGGSSASCITRKASSWHAPLIECRSTLTEPWIEARYNDHFCTIDPIAPRMGHAALGEVVIAKRYLNVPELERTEFYQDWARPSGMAHVVNAAVHRTRGRTFIINLAREHESPDFGDTEVRKLKRLFPYIRNAFIVEAHLNQETERHALVERMLDAFAEPTFLLDRDQRVVAVNALARTHLESDECLRLDVDRLYAIDAEQCEKLSQWLAAQRHTTGQSVFVLRGRSGEAAWRLITVVLPETRARQGERLLFVRPFMTLPQILSEQELKDVLKLTTVEASIVHRLAQSFSLEAIAASLDITIGTARNHLKRVFTKLGINRQTELVALVLGLTPTIDVPRRQGT